MVAIDSRRPRDGRALEILGSYDPLAEPLAVHINAERLAVWLGKGALPSATVAKLMKLKATPSALAAPPTKPSRSRKPAASTAAKVAE